MKKLTLRLGDLRVETFTTGGQRVERGTVQGHYGTTHTQATNCGGETCEYESCLDTCGAQTCGYTCAGYATFGPNGEECRMC